MHNQIPPSTPRAELYKNVPQSLSWEQHTFSIKQTEKQIDPGWLGWPRRKKSGELLLMPQRPTFDPWKPQQGSPFLLSITLFASSYLKPTNFQSYGLNLLLISSVYPLSFFLPSACLRQYTLSGIYQDILSQACIHLQWPSTALVPRGVCNILPLGLRTAFYIFKKSNWTWSYFNTLRYWYYRCLNFPTHGTAWHPPIFWG